MAVWTSIFPFEGVSISFEILILQRVLTVLWNYCNSIKKSSTNSPHNKPKAKCKWAVHMRQLRSTTIASQNNSEIRIGCWNNISLVHYILIILSFHTLVLVCNSHHMLKTYGLLVLSAVLSMWPKHVSWKILLEEFRIYLFNN
jgi:hypothetical protein